ncbi:MAG: nitroreductase family protein [Lachnospiraceae bacterium]|nr:nitroreductase family protein [Lachnospiraceae bacterium]
MNLLNIMEHRRSIRKYSGEAVSEEYLQMILQAGLLGPTGHNARACEFVLVKEKAMLETLSKCRPAGPGMLAGADAAIVVLTDGDKQDVWAEDGSIAMSFMHLMADSLGVGSCWVQVHKRIAPDGRTAEEYIKEQLAIPDHYKITAMLSLGMPAENPAPKMAADVDMSKVHYEKF